MSDTRVRMGFKPNAKGRVPIDVTAESPDAETTATALKDGIAKFRKLVTMFPTGVGMNRV